MQPAFTYLDVGGYNYQWAEYDKDHVKYPDRVMAGTESFPNPGLSELEGCREEQLRHRRLRLDRDRLPRRVGHRPRQHSQRAGCGCILEPYPWFNSYCGDIDLIGNKKPQSYFRDVVWRRSKVEMAVQRPLPERL